MSPAQKKRTTSGKTNATRKPVKTAPAFGYLSWFMTGLMSGLFIALIVYLGLLRPAQMSANNMNANAGSSDAESDDSPWYSFYQTLPEIEVGVNVVPVDVAVADPELREQDNRTFHIQVASFLDPKTAESLMANLLLMNLDAKVVPGVVNGQTWHRVQLGPFHGRKAADDASDILAANNLEFRLSEAK